jgi:hypothetical protein
MAPLLAGDGVGDTVSLMARTAAGSAEPPVREVERGCDRKIDLRKLHGTARRQAGEATSSAVFAGPDSHYGLGNSRKSRE